MIRVFLLIFWVNKVFASVVIIGAGLAGLTAAYRLEQAGFSVEIYEARNRPGGRILTIPLGSSYGELGGNCLNDGGEALEIKALIEEMGLKVFSHPYDYVDRRYVEDGKVFDYYDLFQTAPFPDEETHARLIKETHKAKNLGEILDLFLEGHEELRFFMEMRMRNYEGSSTYHLAPQYIESFWNFYKELYLIFLEKDKKKCFFRFETIKGGNQQLIDALVKKIKGPIYYGCPLRRISKHQDKIILHFEGGEKISIDTLLLTLPFSTLRDVEIEEGIIPHDQKRIIQTLQYGTNAKILLPVQFEKTPLLSGFNYTRRAVTWFNAEHSVMTLYYGGKEGIFDSYQPILEKEWTAIEMLFPGLALQERVEPIAMSWVNEEFSKGSYCNFGAEDYFLFHQMIEECGEVSKKVFRSIDGKIFFAGEHTALAYPGTMEGAVESGNRIARTICKARNDASACHFH